MTMPPVFTFFGSPSRLKLSIYPRKYSNPYEMSRKTSPLFHQLFRGCNDTFQGWQKRPLVPIGKKFVGAGDYTRPHGKGARGQLIEQTTHVRRVPGPRRLVLHDQYSPGLVCRFQDGLPIQRLDKSQTDDFDRTAIPFLCQFIGGIFGQSRGSPCGNDRKAITRAGYARFGPGVGSSDFTRTVVNRAVLKKQRGCWALQSVTETPVSLIGRTRHGDIEIRNVVKP